MSTKKIKRSHTETGYVTKTESKPISTRELIIRQPNGKPIDETSKIGDSVEFIPRGSKTPIRGVIKAFIFDKRVEKEYAKIEADGKIYHKMKGQYSPAA